MILEWIKSKIIWILVILLALASITIFIQIKIIKSKNKTIEQQKLVIKGYEMQAKIRNTIEKMDVLTYAEKKKLLDELYSIGSDFDKLASFLNKLYSYRSPTSRNTTSRRANIQGR